MQPRQALMPLMPRHPRFHTQLQEPHMQQPRHMQELQESLMQLHQRCLMQEPHMQQPRHMQQRHHMQEPPMPHPL